MVGNCCTNESCHFPAEDCKYHVDEGDTHLPVCCLKIKPPQGRLKCGSSQTPLLKAAVETPQILIESCVKDSYFKTKMNAFTAGDKSFFLQCITIR